MGPFFYSLRNKLNMKTISRALNNEFKSLLAGFAGSENHYLHRLPDGMTMKLTDGCQMTKEYTGASWLFDIILSWQFKLRKFTFQVWKLTRQGDGSWFIQCLDGNDHVLGCQEIHYSEFPLDQFEVWLIDGVCLLPSEY